MSHVSAVLDRLRSAARRPSPLAPVDAGLAMTTAPAGDADHWHAGDTRVVLPAPRRPVDLRALEEMALVPADAALALPRRPAQAAQPTHGHPTQGHPTQAWHARPGPTTWFG